MIILIVPVSSASVTLIYHLYEIKAKFKTRTLTYIWDDEVQGYIFLYFKTHILWFTVFLTSIVDWRIKSLWQRWENSSGKQRCFCSLSVEMWRVTPIRAHVRHRPPALRIHPPRGPQRTCEPSTCEACAFGGEDVGRRGGDLCPADEPHFVNRSCRLSNSVKYTTPENHEAPPTLWGGGGGGGNQSEQKWPLLLSLFNRGILSNVLQAVA